MTNNTSSASPKWVMPALVGTLLFPIAAHASEGNDTAWTAARASIEASTEAPSELPITIAGLTVAPPPGSEIRAAKAPAPAASVPPAPRAIAAGPVWSDESGAWRQDGTASWYGGRRWHGRMTASGTRYDETRLTAAHASLPIGSQVRVTVADTGRTVIVTINDRPGTRRRIIDLSRAAAEALGILQRGVAHVALTPASPPPAGTPPATSTSAALAPT